MLGGGKRKYKDAGAEGGCESRRGNREKGGLRSKLGSGHRVSNCHVRDVDSYPKEGGNPLQGFKQRNNMIIFAFWLLHEKQIKRE